MHIQYIVYNLDTSVSLYAILRIAYISSVLKVVAFVFNKRFIYYIEH